MKDQNKVKNHYAIIMAGGVGSRFWPLSRMEKPKQFLDILGLGKSLLQMTVERFEKVIPRGNILVVSSQKYKSLILEQVPQLLSENILMEPTAKNTAPCIAYATYKLRMKDENALCVVAPSDHLITNEEAFLENITQAFEFASQENVLITLGIEPHRPDTGYGYIQFDKNTQKKSFNKVKTFTEKPNIDLAQTFLESGDFLWNAGIFVWNVNSIIQAFGTYAEELDELFDSISINYFTELEQASIKEAYEKSTAISIDYAIMEKAKNVYVLPSTFGWSDLGTWKSLYDFVPKDSNENFVLGDSIQIEDTQNSLIVAEGERLVVVDGVKDLFVVSTDKAVLICHQKNENKIKGIVKKLKEKFNAYFN